MLMLPATSQGRDSFAQQVLDDIDVFYAVCTEQADYASYLQKTWGQKTDWSAMFVTNNNNSK